MNIKQRMDADLKTAMLGGNKTLVTTLRGLKSAVLYAEVAAGKRDEGLSDEEVVVLLQKEAKKRQESAELYEKGGNNEKAKAELAELKVIEGYLPTQLNDEELSSLVDKAIGELGDITPQTMGRAIGRVKELSQGRADGARIAKVVRERVSK